MAVSPATPKRMLIGRQFGILFFVGILRNAMPVLVPFLASRFIIFGVILLSKLIIVRGPYWRPGGLLEVLTQWDGIWYLHIARHGYFYTPETRGTVAFFPLYPLSVRLAAFVFHDFRVAAVLMSNVCLLFASLLLNALIKVEYDDPKVNRAALMFLLFGPVSFFFSSAYTESTFLLLAVASFLAALRGRWLVACLCGLGLAATRNVGFWIAVPLFIEYVRQTWKPGDAAALFHPRILLLGLVPLGLLLFMLFGLWKGNDLLAFSHAGADWGRVLVSPLRTLSTVQFNPPFYRWLFLGALTTGLLLWTGGFFFKIRASYLVWAALLITTYLCSNSLEGMPRYLSVVFPLYLVLALFAARFEWSYEPILASSVALLILCTVLSANGYWMT